MKKIGVLVSVCMVLLSISGCGSATNNLMGTRENFDAFDSGVYDSESGMYDYYDGYGYDNTYGYNQYDTYGYGSNAYGGDMGGAYREGGNAYWDGYGINEGRTVTSDTGYERYTTKSMLN